MSSSSFEPPSIPPDLPDEYLLEIGRVNARWPLLESMMDICLTKLIGKDIEDARSQIIFQHMAFPMKLDIMGALMSGLLPQHPKLAGHEAVLQLLKQAQEKRNMVVHGFWNRDPKTQQVMVGRVTARGLLKVSNRPISASEIREAADTIVKAGQRLFYFVANAGTTNKAPHSGQ